MASTVILGPGMLIEVVHRQPDEPDTASGSSVAQVDAVAVRACLAGDTQAFDGLVERHQRSIYRLCYRYAGNHHDANDLAQESFLKAYRALGRFRGDSAFATWLHRIAVNTCLNHKVAHKRQMEELSDSVAAPGGGHGKALEEADERRRVRAAVEHLPEKQRKTLLLKVYDEMTHEEVARTLGSSVGTVKANLFHAVANLRKILGRDGSRR